MGKELRILFTSAGRRIELIQAFRLDATRIHQPIRIYGTDLTKTAPALSFCDEAFQTCRINNKDYIPTLINICKQNSVDLLVPTIDTDLLILSQNKGLFKQIGTNVLVSDKNVIEIANDKRNTCKFFNEVGVKTPETFDDFTKYNLGFPCFIKPMNGSASKDVHIVLGAKELAHYADTIDDYIVQNLVEGEEFTVDVLCDLNHKPLYITPRKRVQVRSGEVIVTEIIDDPQVVDECKKILQNLQAIGPITIQYIKETTTGRNYYIEINPRFGGGSPLSMKAGAHSPEALLRIMQGETVKPQLQVHSLGAIYSRFDQSVRVNPNFFTVSDLSELHDKLEQYDAVIFDLDDTLYNELDYVKSGFKAVATITPQTPNTFERLMEYFAEGKVAIDTLLNDSGNMSKHTKDACVRAYRDHKPDLKLTNEVKSLLIELRKHGKKIGIISDGRPIGQRTKIAALGIEEFVDEIIITDELAGTSGDIMNFRKPNDTAFTLMQRRLGVALDKMVYIADNTAKDFHACRSLGFDGIHYINKTGLHQPHKPNHDDRNKRGAAHA